jgi:hypothetical protein
VTDKVKAAIAYVAGRQRGNVTYAQLVRIGLTPDAIKHLVRIGFLHRVYRGLLFPWCDRYGVPRPQTQVQIGPFRCDAVYAAVRPAQAQARP